MSNSDPANMPADVHKAEKTETAQPPQGAETEGAETREQRKARRRERKKQRQVLINEDELKELEEKSKKADEYYGHYTRARADLDNFRKRTQREKEGFVKFANEQLLSEVIPIIENFERASSAAEKVPETHNFALGVEMILKQLRDVLARYGAEEIDPAGEPFDPAKHEAAEPVETSEHPDNTVIEVLQRGYMLNGRVVQPAVVRVAVNPEAVGGESEDSYPENNTDTDTKEDKKDG